MTDRITYTKDGQAKAFDGIDAVRVYQLAAIMTALRIEGHGIKVTRGKSALAIAKKITGLKTNKREVLLERLQRMLDAQKDKVEHYSEPGPIQG